MSTSFKKEINIVSHTGKKLQALQHSIFANLLIAAKEV